MKTLLLCSHFCHWRQKHYQPQSNPGLHFELTLAQANCSHPVLSELSNDGLLEKINETLMDMGCHFESRPCTPDHDGSVVREYVMPHIRAVGCHHSGDIWLVTYSEAECDFLACAAHRWALRLSSQLSVAHKTFPVLVHGMPTNFDPLRSSADIRHLITQNDHLVTTHRCYNVPSSSPGLALPPSAKLMDL